MVVGAEEIPGRLSRRAANPVVTGRMLVAAVVLTVTVLLWHVFALPLDMPYYGLFDNGVDLAVYQAGGQTIRAGAGLYDVPVLFGMEFTYTPFAALVFMALAPLSLVTAETVWWAGTFAALVALVGLCLRAMGYRNAVRTWVFALLLAVCCTALEPVRTTIWLGQINIFLALLIVWDLTRPSAARWRGVGVGIAAGIKLTPVFFLVYLAWTRQWRSLGVSSGAFAATIILGFLARPGDSYSYWSRKVITSARVGAVDSPGNQSVKGFLAQVLRFLKIERFSTNTAGMTVFQPPAWLWLAVLLPVAALGLAAAARAHRTGRELLAITVTGMTPTCVSPFSWGHHWVWFVPLVILAWHHARTAVTRWAWFTPAVVVLIGFSWWWTFSDRPEIEGAPHPVGIGLFMMPRPDNSVWWAYITVPTYAGCYPLLLVATSCYVLLRKPVWPSGDSGRRDPGVEAVLEVVEQGAGAAGQGRGGGVRGVDVGAGGGETGQDLDERARAQ